MGLSNQTSFLRPVTEGTINAVARARHRGRTTWVWEVELTDDDGRLCALTRVTVAVRPLPGLRSAVGQRPGRRGARARASTGRRPRSAGSVGRADAHHVRPGQRR